MAKHSKVSIINSHVAVDHDMTVTNVIHIKSRKRLIQCECGGRFFASALDIERSELV